MIRSAAIRRLRNERAAAHEGLDATRLQWREARVDEARSLEAALASGRQELTDHRRAVVDEARRRSAAFARELAETRLAQGRERTGFVSGLISTVNALIADYADARTRRQAAAAEEARRLRLFIAAGQAERGAAAADRALRAEAFRRALAEDVAHAKYDDFARR